MNRRAGRPGVVAALRRWLIFRRWSKNPCRYAHTGLCAGQIAPYLAVGSMRTPGVLEVWACEAHGARLDLRRRLTDCD